MLNGGTTELVLGWNAAVDNGTVTEYLVYADGNLLGTTGGLTLAHSGLTPGSQHGDRWWPRTPEATSRCRAPP